MERVVLEMLAQRARQGMVANAQGVAEQYHLSLQEAERALHLLVFEPNVVLQRDGEWVYAQAETARGPRVVRGRAWHKSAEHVQDTIPSPLPEGNTTTGSGRGIMAGRPGGQGGEGVSRHLAGVATMPGRDKVYRGPARFRNANMTPEQEELAWQRMGEEAGPSYSG